MPKPHRLMVEARKLRDNTGLSLERVGQKHPGHTGTKIGSWERGYRQPTASDFDDYAQAVLNRKLALVPKDWDVDAIRERLEAQDAKIEELQRFQDNALRIWADASPITTAPPSGAITTLTCYRLDCDGCGKPIIGEDVEGYEYAPHYDTPEQALAHLHGDPDLEPDNPESKFLLPGQQLPDGRILCRRCNQMRLCHERGHLFDAWHSCWSCAPRGSCDHQQRECDRWPCQVRELRTVAAMTGATQ